MGIDDAGRGAVIGPLVIAGASFFKKDLKKLDKVYWVEICLYMLSQKGVRSWVLFYGYFAHKKGFCR